jgi:RNA polymerase sigma factor (sigma-70 family)
VANDPYTEHAEAIEAILAYTRRVNRLSPDAGDEFVSWARLKMIEEDQRVLRSFQARGTFKTFLITVVKRLFHDWRNHEWGRWRPSSLARRLGPIATELECLVLRDGIEYEQACEWLLSKGVAHSRRECDDTWAQLPRRAYRQSTVDDALEMMPASPQHDEVTVEDQRLRAARASEALERSLPTLPPSDQMLIRWRYQDAFTVARIAKLLGVEQKPLYRRLEQILVSLRRAMADAGVPSEDVMDLFGNPLIEFPAAFRDDERGNTKLGPSSSPNAGGVR